MEQLGLKRAPEAASKAVPAAPKPKPAIAVEPLLLLVLVFAASAVRLWPVWRVHYWDEAVYLQNAEVICCAKTNYAELDSRPPLLSILYAAAFLLWHSPYAASILTAVLNGVGALFLYLCGRMLFGRKTGAIAAVLFAFSPFLVRVDTGNSLLTDSPAVTLVLVSLWLMLLGIQRNAPLLLGLGGLTSSLAVLMRFASLPVVALLWVIAFGAARWLPSVAASTAGYAAGFAPYMLWSRLRYGGFLETLHRGWGNVTGSSDTPSYYVRNFVQVFGWISVAGIVLLVAGGFLYRRFTFFQQDPEALGTGKANDRRLVYGFLCAWIVIVLAYYSAIAHKELRYVLPLAIPVFLLAARGLAPLVSAGGLKSRAAGGAILAVALLWSFAPDAKRFREPLVNPFVSEEKQVGEALDRSLPSGASLYVNFNYPVFGYYTHLKIRRIDYVDNSLFYENFPKNMPVDGYMLVYKEVDKDPHIDWLDSNPHFRRFHEFASMVVYEYRVQAN